ncbi:hypothetical protein ACFX13_035176 [Malus domestica]
MNGGFKTRRGRSPGYPHKRSSKGAYGNLSGTQKPLQSDPKSPRRNLRGERGKRFGMKTVKLCGPENRFLSTEIGPKHAVHVTG